MSPMFHSSSRSSNRRNPDGANDVVCYNCGAYIGRTYEKFFRALCALCARTEEGKMTPEEAIRLYKLSKQGKEDISMLLLPREPKLAKFSFNSITGYLLRALGIAKEAPEEPRSVEIAKSKKRPRLFENVELGSMEDVDKKSREQM